MDVRRRRQVRAGICVALPALALTLWTVLGLGATADAASGGQGHGHSAMAPTPQRPVPAIVRMQDPIGFDLVAAEQSIETSHAAGSTVAAAPGPPPSVEPGGEHNRGPPGGELV